MNRSLALAAVVCLPALMPAQAALFRLRGDLVPVAARHSLEGCLEVLFAGPTAAQRTAGLTTAIPPGTAVLGIERRDRDVNLTLNAAFLGVFDGRGHLEDAIEQIVKTVRRSEPATAVFLDVRSEDGVIRPLAHWITQFEPPLPVQPRAAARAATTSVPGALAGKTIAFSPGHGYYWHSSLGWTTQRPTIGGLTEDLHTNEIAMRYAIPALENMGARVISVRERGEITSERIADNDAGAPIYTESGAWTTSTSTGYSGGSYRYATTAATNTATATWTVQVPADGQYPVYVFYRAGTNRTPDARYLIHHSGGTSTVAIDQSAEDLRWRHLGNFYFQQAQGAVIELQSQSSVTGKVVIADAVRVGGGLGSIARGSGPSGRPRWQEASRYWAEFAGAPVSVYTKVSCGEDNCDDVTARPKYAEWRGADAYVSLHTNAGGGAGTSSFIHNTSPTAGSAQLQSAVHNMVVSQIRALYDPTWTDRGRSSANFGEVRELQTMPGVLLELAFHDQVGSVDHNALHDPKFRRIAGRAIARGVMRYFNPSAPLPPVTPIEFAVTQDGTRGLLLSWSASPGASGYAIEQSPDGKGFVEVAQTGATTWSTGVLPAGTMLSFRVRAFNPSGRSFATEVLTAGTSHTGSADLLLVQGFDRLGKAVKLPENTGDYLRLHGDAIRRGAEFSLGFDAANNDAVASGRVALAGYRAVDWAAGEESTADETFSSAEQVLVQNYVQAGGRLLVSGAEIGWDLDANGSAADRAFYRNVLGARYVKDDAGVYAFAAAIGGIFAGVPAGTLDDGTGGTYNVDWPDVITAADGNSRVTLVYSTGEGAAIERVTGNSRVVHWGFPLETVTDRDVRAALMARALRFLLSPRPLESPASVSPGASLPLQIELPAEPQAAYVLASSLGLASVPLPGNQIFPLQIDGLLSLSLSGLTGTFVGFQGRLDSGGMASAQLVLPPLPALAGIDFYHSGFTLNSQVSVQTMLPWVRARVQ